MPLADTLTYHAPGLISRDRGRAIRIDGDAGGHAERLAKKRRERDAYAESGEADWPTLEQLMEDGITGVLLGATGQAVSSVVSPVVDESVVDGAQKAFDDFQNSDTMGTENDYTGNPLLKAYLKYRLRQRSPLDIPPNALIKIEFKSGYRQVKYVWSDGEYTYTSRWHTRTPSAPADQGNTWVVQRDRPGVGYGQNLRPPIHEILVGENEWISRQEWKAAARAHRRGTATQEQEDWLNHGHWKDER